MEDLKTKRRAAGVTLDELAKKSGISIGYISRIESHHVSCLDLEERLRRGIEEVAAAKAKLNKLARQLGLRIS